MQRSWAAFSESGVHSCSFTDGCLPRRFQDYKGKYPSCCAGSSSGGSGYRFCLTTQTRE